MEYISTVREFKIDRSAHFQEIIVQTMKKICLITYFHICSVACILVFSGQMVQNPANGGLQELDLALMVQRDTPAELAQYYIVQVSYK